MSTFTQTGYCGEDFVAQYLSSQGYEIVRRNYHCIYGEIDIIAKDGNFIVFIEVKVRKKGSLVSPLESVSRSKKTKIIKSAVKYMTENGWDLQPRFDIFALEIENSGNFQAPEFEHFKNAFTADGMGLYV